MEIDQTLAKIAILDYLYYKIRTKIGLQQVTSIAISQIIQLITPHNNSDWRFASLT